MVLVSLLALLSHICITALAAGPLNLFRPTLLSSPSPHSPRTPPHSIDLASPTGLHANPPEVPWDIKVTGTNTNLRFIHFEQNESGNDTEGLICIRDAIAAARIFEPSALIGNVLLAYDSGATSLQVLASKPLTWEMWLETLLLLEHVTEIYPTWQYVFNFNVVGEERFLGSGSLLESRTHFATA